MIWSVNCMKLSAPISYAAVCIFHTGTMKMTVTQPNQT